MLYHLSYLQQGWWMMPCCLPLIPQDLEEIVLLLIIISQNCIHNSNIHRKVDLSGLPLVLNLGEANSLGSLVRSTSTESKEKVRSTEKEQSNYNKNCKFAKLNK